MSSRVDPYGDLLGNLQIARFGTTRFRCGAVAGVTLSADDRLLACGSALGAFVYKAATGKELLRVGSQPVSTVALSPVDGRLAVAHADGLCEVYDPTEVRRLQRVAHGSAVSHLRFTPDGVRLASAGPERAVLWDLQTGARVWEAPGRVAALAVAPDGQRLALALPNVVVVWNGADRHDLAIEGVGALDFAADGALVLVSPNGVQRWDVESASRTSSGAENELSATALALSPAGGTIAVGTLSGEVLLLRSADFAPSRRIDAHSRSVTGLAWSSDGAVLVSVSDGEVGPKLWSPDTGRRIVKGDGHEHPVRFVRAGGEIVVTGARASISVWDRQGRRLSHSSPGPIRALDLSRDGALLLVATEARVVAIDAPGSGDVERTLLGHGAEAAFVAPDGVHALLTAGDRHLCLRLEDGGVVWEEAAAGPIVAARFEGSIALAACNANELRRWNLDRGFLDAVEVPSGFGVTALAPDRAVTGDAVLDLTDGSRIGTVPAEGAAAMAFSADGRHLAVAKADSLTVHDLKTGTQVLLKGHSGPVVALWWAPDGVLYSGSADCTALAWSV